MERLTVGWGNGTYDTFDPIDIADNQYSKINYEKLLNKLGEYEDLEEQGLLLKLPCKVGDAVYLVDFEEMEYDEATVWSIEIDTRDNRVLINSDYEVGTYAYDNYIYYSIEEAEAALERMKGE